MKDYFSSCLRVLVLIWNASERMTLRVAFPAVLEVKTHAAVDGGML